MSDPLEKIRTLLQSAGEEISQINTIIEVTKDSWHIELDDAATMQIFLMQKLVVLSYMQSLLSQLRNKSYMCCKPYCVCNF